MAVFAKFYQKPHHMEFLSEQAGRPIHEMKDYVRIEIPGIVANVVDTLVSEAHKRDYPQQWAQYMVEKGTGNFSEHQGTLLRDWPQLNPVQVLELNHLKFYTVEQVAEASDLQLGAIGMLAGMSPLSLRDKAKAWLDKTKGADATAELAKRDEQIATLQAQMAELLARDEPKKLGRPKKETADA